MNPDAAGGQSIIPTLVFGEAGDHTLGINLERLLYGRLMVSATSGAGKSWMLRYFRNTLGSLRTLKRVSSSRCEDLVSATNLLFPPLPARRT